MGDILLEAIPLPKKLKETSCEVITHVSRSVSQLCPFLPSQLLASGGCIDVPQHHHQLGAVQPAQCGNAGGEVNLLGSPQPHSIRRSGRSRRVRGEGAPRWSQEMSLSARVCPHVGICASLAPMNKVGRLWKMKIAYGQNLGMSNSLTWHLAGKELSSFQAPN